MKKDYISLILIAINSYREAHPIAYEAHEKEWEEILNELKKDIDNN